MRNIWLRMVTQLPPHVEWIADHMGDRMRAELARQNVVIDLRDALAVLCEADPTPGKRAVQWLADRLLDRGFLWEDVQSGLGSKVHETLVAFGTHRRVLPKPERNLAAHATLASVWKAVAHLMVSDEDMDDELGIRERRRREKAQARAESIILCERPGFTVAVPLTETASRWWGRNTRWCTAADKNNAFGHYDAIGPLIVVVMPDEKFQLFMDADGTGQFMDSSDAELTEDAIESRWNDIGPLVLWSLKRAPLFLRLVPAALRDRETCLPCVRRHGITLRFVSHELRDSEMCRAAVMQNGMALQFIPDALRNYKTCLVAVRTNGRALRFVPETLRDFEMCSQAAAQEGMALEFVPEGFRSREFCMSAVKCSGRALRFVPESLRDLDMCLMAVAQSGLALRFVPKSLMQNTEIILAALNQNGLALQFVDTEAQNFEICLAAVKQDGIALLTVSEWILNRQICLAAVTRHGMALSHVPERLRDVVMCMTAVNQNSGAMDFVPAEFQARMVLPTGKRECNDLRTWSVDDALSGLADALRHGLPDEPSRTI